MKLVLTGPAGSGKTHRILAEFREALKSRRSDIRLVVPTATLAQHLRHALAREGLVFSPRSIVTLAGFINQNCGDLQLASNAALTLAAEAAVREVNAPDFTRVSRMPGFHAALVHTIGELDASGCAPEEFSCISPDAPLAEPLLAVWTNMERQLASRGLLTRTQILRRAAGSVAANVRRMWLDGFVGFARPELEFIEGLSAKADVTVALQSLSTAVHALADLRAAGFEFAELAGASDPDEQTRPEAAWFQAENPEREADEIARRILLYQQSGREFKDIAVVLRTAEDLAPLLETAFERFGIPAHYYFSGPLGDHPVAGFAMRLVDAFLTGWDFEATLAALRLMPELAPGSSLDRWDIAIREYIPSRGLDALHALGVEPAVRFAELDSWRSARWGPTRWAEALGGIPARFAPGRPQDGKPWNETQIARGQAAATKAWAEAMQAAARWFTPCQDMLSLADFWKVADSVVRLTPLTVPDARRNVVHVMSVFEARQWNPAVMFVPNLIEKVFPRYHPQDPFLPDSAVRQLQAAGIRLRDSRDRDAEEACLFDSLVSGAREICLSYPRRNARGDENLRSSFFERVRARESQALLSRPMLATAPLSMRAAVPVRSADLLVRIAERHSHFTPSGLESYARCPFQFFGNRTLKLESLPDTPEERLSFLVQGTIVHEVLKRWIEHRGDVKPYFDEVFETVCEKKHIQRTYRTEVLRRRMLADLENFCSGFRTFGDGDSLAEQPFDLALAPGVHLKGRIDRIDNIARTGAAAAVIIDHKYSNNTKQNVDDETRLQGVLYTLAAERELGLKPQAMVFLSVKGGHKPVGWGDLPGYDLPPITAEWLQKGLATVDRLVGEIRAGSVEPKPSSLKHCIFCEVRDACRFEEASAVRGA